VTANRAQQNIPQKQGNQPENRDHKLANRRLFSQLDSIIFQTHLILLLNIKMTQKFGMSWACDIAFWEYRCLKMCSSSGLFGYLYFSVKIFENFHFISA